MSLRLRNLNPYDLHKALINEHFLKRPGDTKLLQRDTSRDRTDADVIRDHHRFLWDDQKLAQTWEEKLAKKYFDKLFKEYTIADLSRYKENKLALRWRIEKEVIAGKGQFTCGNKICSGNQGLRTWEVNFAYVEQDEKKNTLVKLRLCPECSVKLNYGSKKREVKRLKKSKRKRRVSEGKDSTISTVEVKEEKPEDAPKVEHEEAKEVEMEKSCWSNMATEIEDKSREDEFDEYLEDLLL